MRLAALVALLLLTQSAHAEEPPAWLGPDLARLADESDLRGPEAALALAQRSRVRTRSDGRVAVVLEPLNSRFASRIDRGLLRALGAEIDAASRSRLRVWIPISDLRRLASHPGVARLRAPARQFPLVGSGTVVSEGLAVIGAEDLQNAGITGAGVSVAVIDEDFVFLQNAINLGELPTPVAQIDLVGTGMSVASRHGTKVSEILADTAPGIDLTLIRVGGVLDLENAIDYVAANGIDVVNLSLAYINYSYYDDLGELTGWVNDSYDIDGVFWSVASGNYAEKHWRGGWLDTDSDKKLEFVAADERLELGLANGDVCVFLTWNQWTGSITNLNLYAYDKFGASVISSTGTHNGPSAQPIEGFCFPYVGGDAPYEIEIRKTGGGSTSGLDLTLFSTNHSVEHVVASSSLTDPATGHGAFSVGAIDVSKWLWANPPIESYSSQGPTNDGRPKPDLVGPDRVSTKSSSFTPGTSFASPHVAGAAALLLEQDPTLTPPEIRALLEGSAFDIGDPGHDNVFGFGQLSVELIPGGAFDTDDDTVANLLDNCEHTPNLDQLDLGMVGGPGADGIGDVCQCGDAAGGASVLQSDVDALRGWLAGLAGPPAELAKCNVRGPSDGGASDCDLIDVVVVRRGLALFGPGLQQACAPALP